MKQTLKYYLWAALLSLGWYSPMESPLFATPPHAEQENSVHLVEDGKTSWVIAVVTPQSLPVHFAAEELARYVSAMSGAALPIHTTTIGAAQPDVSNERSIVIGLRRDLSKELLDTLPPATEGHDGYAISVAAGDGRSGSVVIAGDNERGVVYGIYDLLERLGCRWFYPALDANDPEVVPKVKSLALVVGRSSTASPFRIRRFEWSSSAGKKDPQQWKRIVGWAMKCRYNVIGWDVLEETDNVAEAQRRGMILATGEHGFDRFLKTEDYFADHPEWFGMQNGKRVPQAFGGSQFCWSNEEARQTFADNVERFVHEHPEIGLLSLYGLDGVKTCTCEACSKHQPSDHALDVMNFVAERLEKSAPHLLVETLGGYPPVAVPPEKTQPRRNLRIVWAHWGRSHVQPYDDPEYGNKHNLDEWLRVSQGRFTAFQYYSDHFAEPWVAAPYTLAIQGDRKYLIEKRADGTGNLLFPEGYWWNSGLNMYLAGKSFYDDSLDPLELLEDYARSYYGPNVGPHMSAYYRQWAEHPNLAYRVRGGATSADRDLLTRLRKEFLDRATEAATDPPYAYRLQKVEKLHSLAERLVAAHLIAKEVGQRTRRDPPDVAQKKLVEAQKNLDDLESYIQSLIDLDQGLVDKQLLKFFLPAIRRSLENQAAAAKRAAGESAKGLPIRKVMLFRRPD